MRPGDHRDFFRFPAPEGRSRESSIVLDERGRFFHEGSLIENANIARAFASWIDVHPDDHRYILNNGYDWTYLTVLGAPVFVSGVEERDGATWLRLSTGAELRASGLRYRLNREGVIEFDLEKMGLFARFLPHATLQLAPYLSEVGDGYALHFTGAAPALVENDCRS
jgi:hypothetical protein